MSTQSPQTPVATDYQIPVLPLEFFHDLFTQCAGETLLRSIIDSKPRNARQQLFDSIQWFIEAKQEYDENNQCVSEQTNRLTIDMTVRGMNAMRLIGEVQ